MPPRPPVAPTQPRPPRPAPWQALAPAWLALGLAAASPALQGQPGPAPATDPAPGPAAVRSDDRTLLQAFGRREGLGRLADDFVERLRTDPRIGHFFKDTNPQHLKQQLADQFCVVLGGDCVYDGETMKNSHADLQIARKDFLALVAVLQAAMDAQGVPFGAQNRLLARLAPMHRDIITVP